jgi:thiosulfate/3-mercaptopyruvate sulfurtransferase
VSDALPRLLEPEQLARATRQNLLLIHVGDAAAYHQAHLPGAVLVEPRSMVSGIPPAPGRLPDQARLEALFAGIGYRPDQHIVAYDDEGGGWAGRFIWTLDVIGHDAWSYLDGGIHAWHAAGLPLETGPGPGIAPSQVSLTLNRAPIAEREDVMAAIGDSEQIIWDVRSPEEYRGERSGARRAGHVPSAINLDWMRLKDPAHHLRLVADLPELLAAHGIDGSKRVITHCHSHHRSGLSYLVGRLLGFADIRGYHGSWADWGNAEDTPVATGPQPGPAPQ